MPRTRQVWLQGLMASSTVDRATAAAASPQPVAFAPASAVVILFTAMVVGFLLLIGVFAALDGGRRAVGLLGILVGGGGVGLMVVAHFAREAVRRSGGGLESLGQGVAGATSFLAGLALAAVGMVVLFRGARRARQTSQQPAPASSGTEAEQEDSTAFPGVCQACGRNISSDTGQCLDCGALH